MKINKSQFNKWINALRSGEYAQTKECLQNSDGYCCLGVACEVLIPKGLQYVEEEGFLIGDFPDDQKYSPKWLTEINDDFSHKTSQELAQLNDVDHMSFDEIADCLEAVYIHKVLE